MTTFAHVHWDLLEDSARKILMSVSTTHAGMGLHVIILMEVMSASAGQDLKDETV
jgi:hypothetical protein